MRLKFIFIGVMGLLFSSCTQGKQSVLEVTSFKLKSTAAASVFNKLDAEVEDRFTNKQPGFIRRQSGINEQGEYIVLVYWNTIEDAKASMQKFMGDESVADYASMIDGSTMKMARYAINGKFNAESSNFVEVMSFKTKEGTDMKAFDKINKKVETGFTAEQRGFTQRITGVSEEGGQVVAVYWDSKTNSDAALQAFMENTISKKFMGMMDQSSIQMGRYQKLSSMKNKITELSNKDKVVALLNSFNTGDQAPIGYINPNKYIQHNLGVGDGLQGFGEVMQYAPPQGFKANVIRAFQDGDYVFTHTEYDFFGPKAGFDVFRFEQGKIVEHWDNLLEVQPANASGRTQFDGATEISDLDKTDANKKLVQDFYDVVIIGGQFQRMGEFFQGDNYIQHNPMLPDGLSGFQMGLKEMQEKGIEMHLTKLHKLLGQGNFVLGISEGTFAGKPYAFYDLFRVENGKIAEHWDVMAEIPPKSEWKNSNGKF